MNIEEWKNTREVTSCFWNCKKTVWSLYDKAAVLKKEPLFKRMHILIVFCASVLAFYIIYCFLYLGITLYYCTIMLFIKFIHVFHLSIRNYNFSEKFFHAIGRLHCFSGFAFRFVLIFISPYKKIAIWPMTLFNLLKVSESEKKCYIQIASLAYFDHNSKRSKKNKKNYMTIFLYIA